MQLLLDVLNETFKAVFVLGMQIVVDEGAFRYEAEGAVTGYTIAFNIYMGQDRGEVLLRKGS